MFEALKQMAKLIEGDGDGEDKDQLNYHVELVGKLSTFSLSFFITLLTKLHNREYAIFYDGNESTRNWEF